MLGASAEEEEKWEPQGGVCRARFDGMEDYPREYHSSS